MMSSDTYLCVCTLQILSDINIEGSSMFIWGPLLLNTYLGTLGKLVLGSLYYLGLLGTLGTLGMIGMIAGGKYVLIVLDTILPSFCR